MPNTTGKTIVITGGTGGIGYQTALALAAVEDGANTIVITGRSQGSAEKAAASITEATGNAKVEFALADMSVQSQVKGLAKELIKRFNRIDELISNAGNLSTGPDVVKSKDGIDMNLAVNVVSHLILVRELVPAMVKGGKVQLVSGGAPSDDLIASDLKGEQLSSNLLRYSHSKRVMEAMGIALAKELKPKGIVLNIVGGGAFAASSMTGSMSMSDLPWYMKCFYPIVAFMKREDDGKSAKNAAQPNIWAAQQTAEQLGDEPKYYLQGSPSKPWRKEVGKPENQTKALQFAESMIL